MVRRSNAAMVSPENHLLTLSGNCVPLAIFPRRMGTKIDIFFANYCIFGRFQVKSDCRNSTVFSLLEIMGRFFVNCGLLVQTGCGSNLVHLFLLLTVGMQNFKQKTKRKKAKKKLKSISRKKISISPTCQIMLELLSKSLKMGFCHVHQ